MNKCESKEIIFGRYGSFEEIISRQSQRKQSTSPDPWTMALYGMLPTTSLADWIWERILGSVERNDRLHLAWSGVMESHTIFVLNW